MRQLKKWLPQVKQPTWTFLFILHKQRCLLSCSLFSVIISCFHRHHMVKNKNERWARTKCHSRWPIRCTVVPIQYTAVDACKRMQMLEEKLGKSAEVNQIMTSCSCVHKSSSARVNEKSKWQPDRQCPVRRSNLSVRRVWQACANYFIRSQLSRQTSVCPVSVRHGIVSAAFTLTVTASFIHSFIYLLIHYFIHHIKSQKKVWFACQREKRKKERQVARRCFNWPPLLLPSTVSFPLVILEPLID